MTQIELEAKREEVMQVMSEWLLVLRSSLNITQEQISYSVGISRQTYSSYELGKKPLGWGNFLSLFLFFMVNEKSRSLLSKKSGYIPTIFALTNADAQALDFDSLLNLADKQAASAIPQ